MSETVVIVYLYSLTRSEDVVCWLCDHPEAMHSDYLENIREMIACYGFAVQRVEAPRRRPLWSYTVGLTAYAKPELVVTGMSMPRSTLLLNDVALHMLNADALRPGEQFPLRHGPLIEIVEVTEPTVYLRTAVEIFGPEIRALQLVHADDRGRWPWQAGFRSNLGQPVLGVRVARQLAGGGA
jgi:hypothetical protein